MFFGHVTQSTLKMRQNTSKYRHVTPNKGHVILIFGCADSVRSSGFTPRSVRNSPFSRGLLRAPQKNDRYFPGAPYSSARISFHIFDAPYSNPSGVSAELRRSSGDPAPNPTPGPSLAYNVSFSESNREPEGERGWYRGGDVRQCRYDILHQEHQRQSATCEYGRRLHGSVKDAR